MEKASRIGLEKDIVHGRVTFESNLYKERLEHVLLLNRNRNSRHSVSKKL
jgi:hypothetical protein